jgi:hypothetical protein
MICLGRSSSPIPKWCKWTVYYRTWSGVGPRAVWCWSGGGLTWVVQGPDIERLTRLAMLLWVRLSAPCIDSAGPASLPCLSCNILIWLHLRSGFGMQEAPNPPGSLTWAEIRSAYRGWATGLNMSGVLSSQATMRTTSVRTYGSPFGIAASSAPRGLCRQATRVAPPRRVSALFILDPIVWMLSQ